MHSDGPFGPQDFTEADYSALDRVVAVLEQLSKSGPPDKIATRALRVLKIIRAIGMGTEPPPLNESEGRRTPIREREATRIELDIPYFGILFVWFLYEVSLESFDMSWTVPSLVDILVYPATGP
ncbi:transcriptional regulator family: Fungal Specific TF [Penicillium desertorum]|uniref:Transcriptional regulator family: Fungal Specific TF n=1 Tax=Penicillium desertorum TaxID=1303715 RepID=A0A9X0BQ16_9EURO|nr:transcriptional regulator family: Fungal Specific TF [Penicillium desertorum]